MTTRNWLVKRKSDAPASPTKAARAVSQRERSGVGNARSARTRATGRKKARSIGVSAVIGRRVFSYGMASDMAILFQAAER
jgi:hypothetical protein